MPTQAYRLRIRNAADNANALIISSVRSDTNPYIASIPSGDGQEVDLLTGAVRTGAYVVEVVDAVTGSNATGTLRILTNQLYDGSGTSARPQLLSRKAFIEVSDDNGASWSTVWIAGYLTNVRQVDAIRYAVTVSNTRRVEQTKQIFTWSTTTERDEFPQRGCVFGGPIIDGFGVGGNRTIDSGGWEFKFLGTSGSLSTPKGGDVLAFSYEAGYFAPGWERKKIPGPNQAANFWSNILPYREVVPGDASLAGTAFRGLNDQDVVPAYPRLLAAITSGANTFYGSIRCMFPEGLSPTVAAFVNKGQTYINQWAFNTNQKLFVTLDDYDPDNVSIAWPALPSVNTIVRARAVARQIDDSSPLYIDLHPVSVAQKLYELIGISVNASSVTTVTAALGATTRVALRITAPLTMAEFLETSIFGPFGFAARINSTNEVEFFLTRRLNAVPPSYTIANADVVGDTPPAIYDLDESTAVTGFVVEQQMFAKYTEVDGDESTPPPDGIRVVQQAVQLLSGDTTTYSTRIVSYKIPGMVHEASSFTTDLQDFAIGISQEGFDRFGRGAPAMDVQVLGTSAAAAAQVGDLVYLNVSYFPNRNYRIGESTVGARVAQVVRREERPEGPVFKLVDAGTYNQPATAPTITIAASTRDPRRIATFTITNAATLNTAGTATVAVEWATGSSAPTGNGTSYIRFSPGNIPTTAVPLSAVTPGTRVHVRARTEQAGIFPSAWTAWQSVTLTAWVSPTSVSVSSITNASAIVSWSLNSNTDDAVDVFVAPGSVAPSDWQPYRITTLSAGTTTTTVNDLNASTAYIVGVAFRDVVGDTRGNVATATFTTASGTTGTASRPAGLQIIPGVSDASLPQGNVLAIWPATGELNTVIARAPDSSGSPGTFADIGIVPASATTYIDYLPRNSAQYWYRIRHETPGKAASSTTPSVAATATGVQPNSVRPSALAPIVTVTTSESGTTATVTIDITDPQNRLEQVRFRERTNNGAWSAWTVDSTAPYTDSATIPASGFVEIEYEVTGFAADGVSRVLAAGIESFDADTIANIVSASGTFSLAGALTLGIQADTDTASFKYITATTDWASDAAALSAATTSGALVNARNVTAILTGPYAVGTTVYLAIAGYTGASGGGTVSGPYRYSFLNGSRDTIPLIARARLFSVSATEAVVRVAVASPIALSPNTATIAYSVTGLSGVTPVTGQTVTPVTGDNVDETSATSYKDFTIPRPAANAVPGRITFTVTATGRVAATPSATIVAQDIVAPSLKIVTTPAANDYSLVVTWDGTIVYDLSGTSQSVSGWTSPRTVTITRNDFLGETKVAAFAVTKNSITTSQSVNVPPKDNAGASITIGTQTADDVTDDYEFSWSTSGFPTGTTYNLTYTTTTTAGVIEQGSLTNQTSPVTVASGFNIGASPTYQMRIDAIKSGTLVLTASRSGTFLT